jgi:Mn-dependent DtxR family transcriptional regulator
MATLPQIVTSMCESYPRNEIASELQTSPSSVSDRLRELRAELERLSKRT